jgi:hypothetical protein
MEISHSKIAGTKFLHSTCSREQKSVSNLVAKVFTPLKALTDSDTRFSLNLKLQMQQS